MNYFSRNIPRTLSVVLTGVSCGLRSSRPKGFFMPHYPTLRIALAFCCLLSPFAGRAAAYDFDVSAATLLKTAPTAAQFPDAGAIVLRDESLVHLNADGSNTDVTHRTIKIFNQRGRTRAEVAIPFNAATSRVSDVHARTIKPDGTLLPAGPGDIHVSAPYSNFSMYDDAKVTAISMPGVEDGVIIDYVYTETTFKSYLPNQYWVNWSFRDGSDPVALSRMTLIAPASLKIQTQAHNAAVMTQIVSQTGKNKTYVWQMQKLGTLLPEPAMPPGATFLPWLEVSTIPSWQTIAGWYHGLASSQMTVSPEVRDIVQSLVAGKTTDTDKARAIYYWVEGRTRYVALELGLSAFQPHPAADVCRNRYGDCKDMATLLVTMLHEAGIKTAWPVLLGAGSMLPVHDNLAAPLFFNHAIVRADLDGKPYWFDSTAAMCSFGQIPGGDRGVDAFVVRDGTGTFETIPLGAPEDNRETTVTTVALHADGGADCVTTIRLVGDGALTARLAFRGVQPAQARPAFQGMVNRFSPDAVLTGYAVSLLEDLDQPVTFILKYHAPLWATKTGHLLIVGGKDMSAAPYDRPSRFFAITQDKLASAVQQIAITLPTGYAVEDKPDDIHEITALGDVDQTVTLDHGNLNMNLVVSSRPGQVLPADYAAAKAQHEKIVSLRKQPIVLRVTG